MTATDEGAALFAAICADPDEDTPRLAYADWLDEQGPGTKPCPRCDGGRKLAGVNREAYHHFPLQPKDLCYVCSGDSFVPDTSGPDRAELIRVQCRIASVPRPGVETWDAEAGIEADGHIVTRVCEKCAHVSRFLPTDRRRCQKCDSEFIRKWRVGDERYGNREEMYLRERALLAAHPEWQHAPCPVCGGAKWTAIPRGLPCAACGGAGDLFERLGEPLHETETWGHPESRIARWSRGWPVLRCTVAEIGGEVEESCPVCRARGSDCPAHGSVWGTVDVFRRSPWAEAVATHAGGLWVGVEVQGVPVGRTRDGWHGFTYNSPAPDSLPFWLWQAAYRDRVGAFRTEAAARAALDRAAAGLIRGDV